MANRSDRHDRRLAPTETLKDEHGNKSVRLDHDAFGVVKVFRTQVGGAGQAVFGSDLLHHTMVSIEVHRAYVDRVHHRDYVYDEENIVRFSMSESAWARHVASVGMGTGVPVSLDRAPARNTPLLSMPDIMPRPKREMHQQEFREMGRKASQGIQDVQDLLKAFTVPGAKPPSKSELAAMALKLRHAGDQFEGNLDFACKSFDEQVESSVQDAMTEIETFASQAAQRVGFDVLAHGNVVPTLTLGSLDVDIVVEADKSDSQ